VYQSDFAEAVALQDRVLASATGHASWSGASRASCADSISARVGIDPWSLERAPLVTIGLPLAAGVGLASQDPPAAA
jgi:hypothetical protein